MSTTMSILIKGAKMPKSCGECQSTLGLFSSKCPLFKDFPKKFDYDPEIGNKGRYDGCPLVEVPPHGRLIDENEILKHQDMVADCSVEMFVSVDDISDAPTVIESEGQKDDKG